MKRRLCFFPWNMQVLSLCHGPHHSLVFLHLACFPHLCRLPGCPFNKDIPMSKSVPSSDACCPPGPSVGPAGSRHSGAAKRSARVFPAPTLPAARSVSGADAHSCSTECGRPLGLFPVPQLLHSGGPQITSLPNVSGIHSFPPLP